MSLRSNVRARVALVRADDHAPTSTTGFWVGLAAGVPIMAYGLRGLLANLPGVQLTSWITFFAGGAIIHDLVLAPVVGVVGAVVVARVPRAAKAPVQAAMVATGVLVLLSWPFIRGYGVTPGETSFLSRNYATSLQICIAAVWVLAAGWTAIRSRRPAPSTHPPATAPPA